MVAQFVQNDLSIDSFDRALTPPAQWYTDPEVLELERERIFRRSWQWVGRLDQVSVPGAYFTCDLESEPIVIVRQSATQLRAFSNVCRHRGGPVARGSGVTQRFACSYHGWTYDLCGALRSAPGFDAVRGFEKSDNCLPELRLAVWGPFIFVNLSDDAPSLERVLGDIPALYSRYRFDDLEFYHEVTLEVDCNWKVYAENSRECLHCPIVHPSFRHAYDVQNASLATYGECSTMIVSERSSKKRAARTTDEVVAAARGMDVLRTQSPPREGLNKFERSTIAFIYVFPNFIMTLAPDHVSASRTIARTPDHMTFVRNFFTDRAISESARRWRDENIQFRLRTTEEDIAICEAVQKRLHSRFFQQNRYSADEAAVYHFHNLLRRHLAAGGSDIQEKQHVLR